MELNKTVENHSDKSTEQLEQLAYKIGIPEDLMKYSEFRNRFSVIIQDIAYANYKNTDEKGDLRTHSDPIIAFKHYCLLPSKHDSQKKLDDFVNALSPDKTNEFLNMLISLIMQAQYIDDINPEQPPNHYHAAIKIKNNSVYMQVYTNYPNDYNNHDDINYIRRHFAIDNDGHLDIVSEEVRIDNYSHFTQRSFCNISPDGSSTNYVLHYGGNGSFLKGYIYTNGALSGTLDKEPKNLPAFFIDEK